MEIIKQLNKFECGLCVLSSLIKHHHNIDVKVGSLLNEVDISNGGISLYDMENVAYKYGLKLESFNANIQEIEDMKSEYFVVLLNESRFYHYVIAKYIEKEKSVEIFCSVKGKYKMSLHELSLKWEGILITCSKIVFSNSISLESKNYQLDYKWLLLINSFNVIHLLLNLFCSLAVNTVMKIVQYDVLHEIFMSVIIIFIFSYFLNSFMQWMVTRISRKYMFDKYQLLHSNILHKLSIKYEGFYNKVDYNYLISFDDYIFIVVNFYSVKINNILSSIITLIAVTFIISFTDILLLIIVFIFLVILGTVDFIRLKYQKNNLDISKTECNQYQNSVINFINSTSNSNNILFRKKQLTLLKDSQIIMKNRMIKNNSFYNNLDFFDSFLNSLFTLFIIFISAGLVSNDKLEFSSMILVISLSQMMTNSTRNICSIPSSLCELKHAKNILYNISKIDNKNNENKLELFDQINQIKFNSKLFLNDTVLIGRSGSGKTYTLKCIANRIKNNNSIIFDNYEKNIISDKWYIENCVYINQISDYDQEIVESLIKSNYKELFLEIINLIGIKSFDKQSLSSGQIQILNFLCLLKYKNKVILLDESLANVDEKMKKILLINVKNEIVKNNFLIYVDHNENTFSNFKNKVVIDEINK
ncbi:MAG: cysteine peptidase family C39 domain-containing protein [Mycoplasma sp.]